MLEELSSSEQPTIPTPTLLIDRFIEECLLQGLSHSHLEEFKRILLASNPTDEQLTSILNHLSRQLTVSNEQLQLSLDIITQSEQIWCFKPSTLEYFQQIRTNNEAVFQALLLQIKTQIAPKQRDINLKAHHIETAIDLLQKQRRIPANILLTLNTYLKEHPVDSKTAINQLRDTHLHEISTQATTAHLLHHTIKHATEIKIRAMYLIQKILRLFASKDITDSFLRRIIRFTIECHDFEQKNKGEHATVEEETAHRITQWLIPSLLSETPPDDIKELIEFLVNYVIVLGTTMIYSPTSTMDLSELFCLFEKAQNDAGIPTANETNHVFLNQLKTVALVTGICDKMPAAVYQLVENQAQYTPTNSLKNLKHYQNIRISRDSERLPSKSISNPPNDLSLILESPKQPPTVLLEVFLKELLPYYPMCENTQEINQQAFLMAIVPHICMRTELSVSLQQVHAQKLIDFITNCQNKHKQLKNDDVFLAFFDTEFDKLNIQEVLSIVFFSNIQKEIDFCLSQTSTLEFAAQHIPLQINSDIPAIDAFNLMKLSDFYLQRSHDDQIILAKELLLNTVLQAGTIYDEIPAIELDDQHSPLQRPVSNHKRQEINRARSLSKALSHTFLPPPCASGDDHKDHLEQHDSQTETISAGPI